MQIAATKKAIAADHEEMERLRRLEEDLDGIVSKEVEMVTISQSNSKKRDI